MKLVRWVACNYTYNPFLSEMQACNYLYYDFGWVNDASSVLPQIPSIFVKKKKMLTNKKKSVLYLSRQAIIYLEAI